MLGILMISGGCVVSAGKTETYLRAYGMEPATMNRIAVCNRPGCEGTINVRLTPSDWARVESVFDPVASNSAEERQQIAEAVALFERVVATQAGTADDRPGFGVEFRNSTQLDCVAEATNTTAYLALLQKRSLLRAHEVRYPRHRGFLRGRFPHNTAAIEEKATGQLYAVDSFFHANGEPPEIVPIAQWFAGFKP
jgi:hypothetical protein